MAGPEVHQSQCVEGERGDDMPGMVRGEVDGAATQLGVDLGLVGPRPAEQAGELRTSCGTRHAARKPSCLAASALYWPAIV